MTENEKPVKVIITGAGRGIGKGIATFLAREGFELGLIARTKNDLDLVKLSVQAMGGNCLTVPCDIRNQVNTEAAINHLVEKMEGVDALINNAGLVIRKDVFELSLEEWQTMMETNVNGVFFATRAVLPHMKEQGSGHIINISSISGRLPLAGGSGYAASKYAVTGFSESLFFEVRDHGIKVTTIFPGSVDTDSHRHDSDEDHTWKVQPEEVGQACRDILLTSPANCISRMEIRPLRKPK